MKNIASRVKQDSKSVEKEPFHGQCGGLYQWLNFIALLPLGEIGKLCFLFFFFFNVSCPQKVFCCMWIPISSATSVICVNGKVRKAIAG